MNDPSGRFWKPLAALAGGYLIVALYLVGFHFWAQGKNPPDPVYWRLTLYYGFHAIPVGSVKRLVTDDGGHIRGYYNPETNSMGYHAVTHPPGSFYAYRFIHRAFRDITVSRAISMLAAFFCAPLLYLIAFNLTRNHAAGIWAATFWLISPFFLIQSHRGPDPFYATLSALVLVAYLYSREKSPIWILVSGLSVPLAALFNFSILPVLIILGIDALYRSIRFHSLPVHFLYFIAPSLLVFGLAAHANCNYLATVLHAARVSRLMVCERLPIVNLFNAMSFLIFLGIPAATGALFEIFQQNEEGLKAGTLIALALLVCSLITPGEAERVWAWLAPFFLIWAGKFWADTDWRILIPMLLLALSDLGVLTKLLFL